MIKPKATMEELKARTLSKSDFKHAYRLARYHNNDRRGLEIELAVACQPEAHVEALNTTETIFAYNLIYEIYVRFVLSRNFSWTASLDFRLDRFKFKKNGYCCHCKETEFCICIPF